MRTLIAIVASSTFYVALAPFVVADESKQPGTDSSPSASSDAWRFRFYQGRWWYWLPTNYWAVYEDGRWLMPILGDPPAGMKPSSSAATRATYKTGAATPAGIRSKTEGSPPADATATNNTEGGSFSEDYPAVPLGPEEAGQSAEYYMSAGSTFSRHAHEHAQILERYAASGEAVPARIVKEQAAAIHHDVDQAHKSFSKLAAADAAENENLPPDAAIKNFQQELRKATELLQQLEAQVQHLSAVQAELVRGQSAIIANLLRQADEAAEVAEERAAGEQRELEFGSMGRRPPGTIQREKNSPRGEE
ncbi:MAG TPA: hypothetical protein VG826_16405 [Pirellulales bacterium]|nr:hypothetical protein [Pirellulales bacterium]